MRGLDFLAAELGVDCDLVDHASMLFEGSGGVKSGPLWTLRKLNPCWNDGGVLSFDLHFSIGFDANLADVLLVDSGILRPNAP